MMDQFGKGIKVMYIPAIGKRVTLKSFSDYTERKLNPWAWFEVISVNHESKRMGL